MRLQLLFVIFPVLMNFGCNKEDDSVTPVDTNTTSANESAFTFLALGDSYTIGQSVVENERWPVQLRDSLVNDSIEMVLPMIIAQTGWRTDNLDAAITNASLGDSTFDLVSILIGVNNQYQGRSVEQFRAEYIDLLNRAIGYAGGDKDRVIVLSIPDYGATPFGASNSAAIGMAIDEFNQEKKEVTDSMGVRFFDITPISRQAKDDNTLVAGDGLHPSGKMYKMWVDLIYSEVKAKLIP